jgi:hypothetical protein
VSKAIDVAIAAVFFCAGGFLTPQCVASTAVILRTDREILVAADSLEIGEHGEHLTTCKIEQMGNVFVAMTGIATVRTNSPLKFDSEELAHVAARTPGGIAEKAHRFRQLSEGRFRQVVEAIHRFKRGLYNTRLRNSDAFAAIFFGLGEGGIPIFYADIFSVDDGPTGTVKVTPREESCPGNACAANGTTAKVFSITKDAGAAYYSSRTGDNVTDLRNMVQAQIKATPEMVNGPIDILRVSPLFTGWIQHKPQCPDLRPIKHQ